MTLEIDHRLHASCPGWERRVHPSAASSSDLLWYYFPGDVRIALDDLVISSSLGSVPALHFVGAILEACRSSSSSLRYEYSFTEADEVITFTPADHASIAVSSTLGPTSFVVEYKAFIDGAKVFVLREIAMLTGKYPGLETHALIQDLMHEVQSLSAPS